VKYMGDFADNSTIQIMFTTHAAAGGSVAPSSALESADVIIYKDNSATQKATVNGLTMTSPFDAIVGLHLLEIDTSVDTGDAGFWAVGSDYSVILSPDETVDSQTVVGALAQFSIENRSDSQTGDSFAIVNGASGSVATKAVVDAIPTTAMRGTEGANTVVPDNATIAAIAGYLDTEIAAIKAVTDAIPDGGALTALLASIASILDDTGTAGVAVSSAVRDSIAASFLDLATGVEASMSVRESLRVILAACGGKCSGADTNTPKYRNIADNKNVLDVVTDSSGNRSVVTLDIT